MANLGKVVYLSDAQYATLIANGSVTVGGQTVTYNANDIYVTPSMPYDNPNKNKLFLNYQIGRFTYSSGGVDYRYPNYCYYSSGGSAAIETRLSLKRSGTEQISKAAHATPHIGLCDVPGGDILQHIYDIQAGDALTYRIGAEYTTDIDTNTEVSIVVNGEEIYHSGKTEWQSGEDLGAFAYTVKEGDMIVINFLNTEIPETAPTTATIVVNSTAYRETVDEGDGDHSVFDYYDWENEVSMLYYDNSDTGFSWYWAGTRTPIDNSIISKTYTKSPGTLSIKYPAYNTSAQFATANIKVRVNGEVLYNGRWENSSNSQSTNSTTLFSYAVKAGDLIVIDWIRIDEQTQEPIVIDNPNKNTLWLSSAIWRSNDDSLFYYDYYRFVDLVWDVELLQLKRGNTSLLHSSPSLSGNEYYSSEGQTVTEKYTLQAGDIIRINGSGHVVPPMKIKIVVNGVTIYDATTSLFFGQPIGGDFLSYTVQDGDEIYIEFKAKETAEPEYAFVAAIEDSNSPVSNPVTFSPSLTAVDSSMSLWKLPLNTLVTVTNNSIMCITKLELNGATVAVDSNATLSVKLLATATDQVYTIHYVS